MKLWTDGRRTTEPSHPISSPGAFGSGELKIIIFFFFFFLGGGGGGGGGLDLVNFFQWIQIYKKTFFLGGGGGGKG